MTPRTLNVLAGQPIYKHKDFSADFAAWLRTTHCSDFVHLGSNKDVDNQLTIRQFPGLGGQAHAAVSKSA